MEKKTFFKPKEEKIQIIPISGLEFVGANCTAIQYKDDIIIIDVGVGFPTADQYGVDLLIPNQRFLKQNIDKIKGIIITHGHNDHIGGLPYTLEAINFPEIFASRFAKELILNGLKRVSSSLIPKTKITQINKDTKLTIGNFKISFFGVNHSIPESMGVVIKTPQGTIVHTGDFKFDNSPINEPHAEYDKIARVGSEKVLCLLSDSTNSYKPGQSVSEKQVSIILDELISSVKGRVVIATFSSMVNRIYELLKIAIKYNKKVFVSGKSMQTVIDISQRIGYIKLPPNLFIKGEDIDKYDDGKVMILATGAQGEHLAALAKMARNEHKEVRIKKGDTIILSASIIPGNDLLVQTVIDQLSQLGADVYHSDIMDLHASGHGNQEDQKLMLNLIKPKFFMPIHGFQSFLFQHGKIAQSIGIDERNIIIARDGQTIEIDKNGWRKGKYIESPQLMVSGSLVGDVGNTVLEDRQQLASYGVVTYAFAVDSETNRMVQPPIVNSRGFVYMRNNQELMNNVTELIQRTFEEEKEKTEDKDIKTIINNKLKKFIFKMTEREPAILSMIIYV